MTKKKILVLALTIAMVAILAVGGSLAYLTDTQSVKNTFTVGDVKIQLLESQYHRVNAGKGNATGLTEPVSGGYLWAANVDMKGAPDNTPNFNTSNEVWDGQYFSDAQIEADAAKYSEYFDEHKKMLPGCNARKNPYVKNIGSNDAYIRVRVLIPVSLFNVIDNGPSYWTTTAMNEGQVTSEAVKAYNAAGYKATNVKQVTHNNIKYYEFDFTYVNPVKPKEITFWNVWGNIAINKDATSDDLANVESFDVIFEADAIQADTFANATEAFAAFDAA